MSLHSTHYTVVVVIVVVIVVLVVIVEISVKSRQQLFWVRFHLLAFRTPHRSSCHHCSHSCTSSSSSSSRDKCHQRSVSGSFISHVRQLLSDLIEVNVKQWFESDN